MAKSSVMDQLRALDEQRQKLMDGAKEEAMAAVNLSLTGLNALGFNFRLVEGGRASSGGTRKGTRTMKDAACPICGFKTNPPHDKRSHRSQKTKKPFTATELESKGMSKA